MDKLKNKCIKNINLGIIIRILSTLLVLTCLSNYNNNSEIYLILPILLIVLDNYDNIFIKQKKCTKTFHYQLNDKINDLLTYSLVFIMFKIDNIYLLLLLWRTIGIILFTLTKKSVYLITMFDFMKEYLLYLYLFNKNNNYLGLCIVGKIIFEYYYHTKVNKKIY